MKRQQKSLAVMQPYFLPYVGYFSLIDSVDHYMFFDDVQYIRKSWMSRNRLLNIDKKQDFYIRPDLIKPAYRELLKNVKLDSQDKWKIKLLAQTNTYKNKAPFFKETRELLEIILAPKFEYLVDFNISSVQLISEQLSLKTKFDKYSDYNFWFDEKPNPEQWGLFVANQMNVSHYINAPGGEQFIKADGFNDLNIKLGFIQPNLAYYYQCSHNHFFAGLSILDVLFFNGIDKTKVLVKQYKITWKS